MGDFAHYLSSKILDYIFGLENYAPPITFYLGLSTTTVNDDGTGVTEPNVPSYNRIGINNNKIVWSTAEISEGKSLLKNLTEFEFNTATEAWGTAVSWFISDSESGGNILAYGDLNPPITINENSRVIIPVNSLTITLD